MELYSSNESYKLYQGNMLDMLEVIEPNSIDSVITDPPYELNFMSKGWDNAGVSFQPDTWKKCYEVLKPGGYLLAFGGSRTFHRIACAIEDAGFEIRDTIMWLYGSGFPKSMDISKSLDKKNNNTKEEYIKFGKWLKEQRKIKNISRKDIAEKLNYTTTAIYNWEEKPREYGFPTKENYLKLKEILNLNNNYDWLIEREEAERKVIGQRKSTAMDGYKWLGEKYEESQNNLIDITTPSTDLAKQWQGWGTALKPSFEPIIVARKPFKGSLVDNVIENGVGGINIDECRVETGEKIAVAKSFEDGNYSSQFDNEMFRFKKANTELKEQGRFPANTILTYDETDFDEVCGGFPNTKSGIAVRHNSGGNTFGGNNKKPPMEDLGYNDSGSASRYFYNAKASKKDRDCNGTIRNIHPTCKPCILMQYLVRLVTPNNGIILDPFNGSGSTGKAVMYENKERNKNYKYIGIELTEEYLPISKARIEYVCKLAEEEKNKERQMSIDDL